MKNVFSLGRLEKCDCVVRRGTARGGWKHGPQPRGRHLPWRGNCGGCGRGSSPRGARVSHPPAAGEAPPGALRWRIPVCDGRSLTTARFSLGQSSLRSCSPPLLPVLSTAVRTRPSPPPRSVQRICQRLVRSHTTCTPPVLCRAEKNLFVSSRCVHVLKYLCIETEATVHTVSSLCCKEKDLFSCEL